jgi:hypothetical protein
MKALNRNFGSLPAFLALVTVSASNAQVPLTPVWLTKQAAPGTPANVRFAVFESATVGGSNELAFTALLEGTGVGLSNDEGLWNRSNSITVLVERESSPAPEVGASITNNGFVPDSIVLNSANQVAYHATLKGIGVGAVNDEALIRGTPGSLVLVARKGFTAAGLPSGANYNGFQAPSLNPAGQVAFKATLTGLGVGASNDEGIWVGLPGILKLVARKGSVTPIGGTIFYDTLGNPVLNPNGQIAFKTKLNGSVSPSTDEAILAGPTNALAVVAQKGSHAAGISGTVNYNGFATDPPAYNRSNQVAFVSSIIGSGVGPSSDQGLWFGAPGALTLVARKGSAAAGLPATVVYNGFGRPVINGSGRIAFQGSLTGTGVGPQNDQAIWVGTPGALSLVARSGSNAPGTINLFTNLYDPIINDSGDIVFRARVSGPGVGPQNDEGVWTVNPTNGVRLVVKKGDFIDVGLGGPTRMVDSITNNFFPGNGEDGLPRTLNEAGQLILNLGVVNSTNVLVVASIGTSGSTNTPPSVPPGSLIISTTNSGFVLSWTGGGVLESAIDLAGPWSTNSSQANPQLISFDAPQRFFRLRQP